MAVSVRFDLPPARALAFFRQKGLKTSFAWQDMLREEHAADFTVAKMADLDLLAEVAEIVDRALAEGITLRDFIDDLKPELMRRGWWGEAEMTDPETGETKLVQLGSTRRLRTIFRVNLRTAYAAGHWSRIQEHKAEAPYLLYDAVNDSRTRPAHHAMDGLVLPVDSPYWAIFYPPNGWNCFPADTPVRADAEVGLKTWYAGEMVELETRLGQRLTVTANHPVLTARGWLAAQQLAKGDQLISDTSVGNARLSGIVDHEEPPVRADDLFESLAAKALRVVPMAAHDFHGDAHLRYPEIHVATTDRHLMNEIDATFEQRVGKRNLANADGHLVVDTRIANRSTQRTAIVDDAIVLQDAHDVGRTRFELTRERPLGDEGRAVERQHASLQSVVAPTSCLPSGAALASDSRRVGLDCLPFEPLGLGASAHMHAGLPEATSQRGAAATRLFGDLLEANAGLVACDEIVEVRQFEWSGHVYDFHARTGLIVASRIVVSNCRCSAIPIDERQLARLGKDGPDEAPPIETRDWTNPRTGEIEQVPKGVDPGWDYNPGAARGAHLAELFTAKVHAAAPTLGASADGVTWAP